MNDFNYPVSENALIVRILHEISLGDECNFSLISSLLTSILKSKEFTRDDFSLAMLLNIISKITDNILCESKTADILLRYSTDDEMQVLRQFISTNITYDELILERMIQLALSYGVQFKKGYEELDRLNINVILSQIKEKDR